MRQDRDLARYTGEAARLKVLAEELHAIASALSPGLIGTNVPANDGSAHLIEGAPPRNGSRELAETARHIYRTRLIRARVFGDDGLFGEPAWDILLDLYLAETDGKQLSVTAACIGSAVPASTALRWIVVLEERGLVARRGDPRDARRIFLHLTDRGRERMEACLGQSDLISAGAMGQLAEL